ncbi:DUF983 domain-containing protein [Sphingomonas sp. IW22]|uniref:DUF983 domain-containing protein n=1 Tax=Sphingomonas sp. IW22 TaxID=3242489 RepID=UPI003520DD9A
MPLNDHEAGTPGQTPPAAPASLFEQARRGLCPRCGEPTLFAGTLRFAPRCAACGLDFDSFNVGDGAAAFLTLGIGTLITILGIVVELAYEPAWWVHVLLWLPLTIAAVLITTRWTKAALAALEYRNNAGEGRIERRP